MNTQQRIKKSSPFYIHRKFFFNHEQSLPNIRHLLRKSEKKRASNSVTVHEADSKQFRHWSSQVYTKDVFWSIVDAVRWFLKQNSVSRPPEHLATFSVGFGGDFGSSFFISSCLPRRGSGYFFSRKYIPREDFDHFSLGDIREIFLHFPGTFTFF